MKTNRIIRQTTLADYATVYEVIKTAFETAEHRDGDEQDFAAKLRNGENYIPQLDLVAEKHGRIIGHILFTRAYVILPDGNRYDTLLVAPLSVLREHRKKGAGSALMQEGLRIAAQLGYGAAFLLGDPGYYQRFGYRPALGYGIGHESFPAEYLLATEIVPGALETVTGSIRF